MSCLFTFLMVSIETNVSMLFSIFSSVTCAFAVISKISLPKPRSQRFIPVFASKSVIDLACTF